jgi:hypothetical protein
MTTAMTTTTAAEPPRDAAALAGGALLAGVPLVRVRCGAFGLLLPLSAVERVLPAALPAARPAPCGADGAPHPVISLGGELVPVLFGEALLGEPEARLRAEDQLLLLGASGRHALLWVSAIEGVEPSLPLAPPPGGEEALVAGWSGGEAPLAVLDVARAVALARAADLAPAGAPGVVEAEAT